MNESKPNSQPGPDRTPEKKSANKPKAPSKSGAKSKESEHSQRAAGETASRFIDERIQSLADWRAKTLETVRRLIHDADPEIIEEWKWMGTPVWSKGGNLCTGETYKQVVKLTFPKGASLPDPQKLFNSSLEGNTRRAIDIREGQKLDPGAFKALIRAAIAITLGTTNSKSKSHPAAAPKAPSSKTPEKPKGKNTKTDPELKPSKVVLLQGGNPQIAKGDGDAPVQAYLAALDGWKRDVGKRLDQLIQQTIPKVRKAVKWNSPFYGVDGQGWFLSFHVFTRYLKVTFFKGDSLRPIPPGGTPRSKEARWLDIHEGDPINTEQLTTWIKQAAALPGWMP